MLDIKQKSAPPTIDMDPEILNNHFSQLGKIYAENLKKDSNTACVNHLDIVVSSTNSFALLLTEENEVINTILIHLETIFFPCRW